MPENLDSHNETCKNQSENEKNMKDFIIQTIIDSLENDTMGLRTYFDKNYYKYVKLKM